MNKAHLYLGLLVAIMLPALVNAHPGNTDKNGGHYCWTNCEEYGLKVGEYHYHDENDNAIRTLDNNKDLYDTKLIDSVKGKILLQVENHGEAWYVRTSNSLRYYMKDGEVAYSMMRQFGLGITDADLEVIPVVQNTAEMNESSSICSQNALASKLKGEILLQVQQHGEAWYIDPSKCRRIYMKDGAAAYEIMRFLGLGITNLNLEKVPVGVL